jgi:hypothetical protein
LVNVEGTVPVSWLLFITRVARETRFPMLLGMDPVREFDLILRTVSRVRVPRLVGSGPTRRFL